MKKTLLLVLLFCSLCATAQYRRLPDSNAVWQQNHFDIQSQTGYYFYYFLPATNADTFINNYTYSKVYFYIPDSIPIYRGAYRQTLSGSQVWFLPKDSVNEYILQDYTVNVGDTIYNLYRQWADGTIILDTVEVATASGMINAGGQQQCLSRWIRGFDYQSGGYDNVWFSSIGSSRGLLNGEIGITQFYENLTCMSYGDTTKYTDAYSWLNFYVGSTCDTSQQLSLGEEKSKMQIRFYPNPGKGEVTISGISNLTNINIAVYNTLGQNVPYNINSSKDVFELVLNQKLPGIYFIQISDKTNSYSLKYILNEKE